MKSLLPIIRTAILMLVGAALGFLFLTAGFVVQGYGYDHGFGETERCAIAATVSGALVGLLVEVMLRLWKT